MSQSQASRVVYGTAFAGISGVAVSADQPHALESQTRAVPLPQGTLRLHKIPAAEGHVLLQVLRDISPAATQQESALVRRVEIYDDACAKDFSLLSQIHDGVRLLDSLALKLTKRPYLEIEERFLRRSLLSQLAEHPLFARIGVMVPTSRQPVPELEPVA